MVYIKVEPLYQGVFGDFYVKFSPSHAEIGIKGILSTLKPTFFRKI